VVEKIHLEGVMGQRIETVSKGYKRRVRLAQALLHDPKVLILDKLTDGLDPNQKHEMEEIDTDLRQDRKGIAALAGVAPLANTDPIPGRGLAPIPTLLRKKCLNTHALRGIALKPDSM
jgi:ABC-type transport system involved in cytochrome bd biosynthesis fused ATPase/permease subunit